MAISESAQGGVKVPLEIRTFRAVGSQCCDDLGGAGISTVSMMQR